MPRPGPRAVRKYSDEFKLTAVRLSQQPGMMVKTVASALEIHPIMLSKWRKDVRDGLIRGRAPEASARDGEIQRRAAGNRVELEGTCVFHLERYIEV